MAQVWKNWSGIVRCNPESIRTPASVEEVAEIVAGAAAAGRTVRVVGSGHSFPPLVATDDVIVCLDNMQGIVSLDRERREATVLAGTKLRRLNELLEAEGLAAENLGDINYQSVAGAISTGTHGTGAGYGNISSQAVGLTLVTASGEVREIDAESEPDLFRAARVSLGALGIIVRVRLRLLPAYRLRYERRAGTMADVEANLDRWNRETRNFEFFSFPYTEGVLLKFLNDTDEPLRTHPVRRFIDEVILENTFFGAMNQLCRCVPRAAPALNRFIARNVSPGVEVNRSHRVFSTRRGVKFNEMEYAVPLERGLEAMNEARHRLAKLGVPVVFPMEYRTVKGDDIWLSPCQGRDTVYIATHQFAPMPYRELFAELEKIFLRHEGRPHWGKLHTLRAEELRAKYPHWDDFARVRRELDPGGVFMNDYLRELLGEQAG